MQLERKELAAADVLQQMQKAADTREAELKTAKLTVEKLGAEKRKLETTSIALQAEVRPWLP